MLAYILKLYIITFPTPEDYDLNEFKFTLSDIKNIAFTEVTTFLANRFLEDFSIYIPYEKFMVPVG